MKITTDIQLTCELLKAYYNASDTDRGEANKAIDIIMDDNSTAQAIDYAVTTLFQSLKVKTMETSNTSHISTTFM